MGRACRAGFSPLIHPFKPWKRHWNPYIFNFVHVKIIHWTLLETRPIKQLQEVYNVYSRTCLAYLPNFPTEDWTLNILEWTQGSVGASEGISFFRIGKAVRFLRLLRLLRLLKAHGPRREKGGKRGKDAMYQHVSALIRDCFGLSAASN